ncbi:MAG: type II toxin-antitoxin system VapC family toxin [Chromatiaceae bacterium]
MMVRLFLDTCIVIDLVEGKPEQQSQLKALLFGKRVVSSELVRMEARLQAVRDQRDDLLTIYDNYFGGCELVPFDRALFDHATRLRIDHRIKTPDALHLAAALKSQCDQFWTNDMHLAKAAGTKLEVWDWDRIEKASQRQGQE